MSRAVLRLAIICTIIILAVACNQRDRNQVTQRDLDNRVDRVDPVPPTVEGMPSMNYTNNDAARGETVPFRYADGGPDRALTVVDSTGEGLVPGGVRRVALSNGNLTLNSDQSVNELVSFYTNRLREMGAQGAVISNPPLAPGEQRIAWKWVGLYDNGKKVDITIYEPDDGNSTIVVLY